MTGYSGTPLVNKLGIRPGVRLFVAGAPPNYLELVTPLPKDVQVTTQLRPDTDIVHVFSTRRTKLVEALRSTLAKMKPDAAI